MLDKCGMNETIITISGVVGMIFVFWFFLLKKENKVIASGSIDITVKGGYIPDVISIPKGKTMKLNFTREDPSSCLEEVVLGDFKIRKYLPLNKKVEIEITPKQAGEFNFTCGMNMFHGKIIVTD